MAVHKFSAAFFEELNVEWPCPACGQKTLQIDKETFKNEDNSFTQNNWSEEWFDHDHAGSVFICMARCIRPKCGEVVACTGKGTWEQRHEYHDSGTSHYQCFKPQSFVPALQPFSLSEVCPDEIADPLLGSFSVFLIQPGAAASLIRICVERMLTAMGVPEIDDKGKRIILHHRLNQLPELYQAYSAQLMAIKFLGNAGSHRHDKVRTEDIEDAYVIMEDVVSDLYSGRKESVAVLTKRIRDKFEKDKSEFLKPSRAWRDDVG